MATAMAEAWMKTFPMEAKTKKSTGKPIPILDVPAFNKAWNIYRDTSMDIMKRFEYMSNCLNFTDKDTAAIKQSVEEFVAPNLEKILDHIYWEKLINDPWLSRWFMDDTGKISNEYVKVRRARQKIFILKIVECKWDEEFWNYVRWVGAVHVPIFGNEDLYIPMRLNIALWGYIHQYLFNLLAEAYKNEPEKLQKFTTAWTKLFWLIIDVYHIDYFAPWM